MERLKNMKEQLTNCVQAQLGDIHNADAKELGEAVDMIKDLAEAIYYCTITEAMKESEKESKQKNTMMYYGERYPVMYYGDGNSSGNSGGGRSYYDEMSRYPTEIRDYREGRSPMKRRMYMESKEMHHDKTKQMRDLEEYLKELSGDITEMVEKATPEEKTVLQQKLNALVTKIK